ncbi:MAG: alpha-E domain-containing protein [Planctomycetaceae bacterium]|nr:alpha-E domain-containing protein [Planctomycetaceae bacterium]
MLSRVANSIYWMSRYVERAENIARFVEVTVQLVLDQPVQAGEQWEPLIRATGDDEQFLEKYGEFTSENVRQFLTFDREYSNSVFTAIRNARENARTVREAISSEAWEQLNDFYHLVKRAAESGVSAANIEFYEQVREQSHLFTGILEGTMSRGSGWHFANLGRVLERADKSSRILDVKYFTLLRSIQDINTTLDDLMWSAVLRSVSGFEMFRKRYHALTVHRVVEFLLLDTRFPRAVLFCIKQIRNSLEEIPGPELPDGNPALRLTQGLISQLTETSAESIINGGTHEFIDDLQTKLNAIGEAIHNTYFAFRCFPDSEESSPSQNQVAQSQSQIIGA